VRLFVQSARRAQPDFELTPANQPGVARICQLVEGMPLGLELAAAWVRFMPVEDIAHEIHHNLDFLTTSMRDMPARHRSLRALFDHSWQLLGEEERGAMRQLSVLRGSFRREAAAQVAGAGLPGLAALVDKSMLRTGPGGRYDMHELVRQYAAEKLRAAPEESQAAGERHCRYFLAFLQERERHLRGARLGEAGAEIAADIDNIRAAWRWAIAHARLAEIGGCMEALHLFYFARSWFQEGHEAFREAGVGLASAGRPGAPRDRGRDLLLARLLARQARFSHRLGLYREARELLQASLEVLRRLEAGGHPGVQRDKAFCLYNLAELLRGDGEYQQSRQLFEESMAIFRASGDRLGLARAMRRLGMIAGSLGELPEAQRLFHQALERFKAIGDPYGIGNTLNDMGRVADMIGNPGEAKRLFQECLAIRRDIGHLWGIGISLNNLGYFAYLHGEYAEAKSLLHESLKIQQEIGDQYQIANCLANLGALGCAQGEYAQARGYYYEALRFAMEIWALPLVLEVLVGVTGLPGPPARWRPAGRDWREPGRAGTGTGGQPAALERAAELCAFVLAHPASEKPTQDMAAARLAELEAKLPPPALAAARARGQAAQLEVVVAELLGELGQAGAE
jgi:predicted ATPase